MRTHLNEWRFKARALLVWVAYRLLFVAVFNLLLTFAIAIWAGFHFDATSHRVRRNGFNLDGTEKPPTYLLSDRGQTREVSKEVYDRFRLLNALPLFGFAFLGVCVGTLYWVAGSVEKMSPDERKRFERIAGVPESTLEVCPDERASLK